MWHVNSSRLVFSHNFNSTKNVCECRKNRDGGKKETMESKVNRQMIKHHSS